MEGMKPLGLHSRFKSTYLPFPLARRLMRGLHAIIGVALGRERHVPCRSNAIGGREITHIWSQ